MSSARRGEVVEFDGGAGLGLVVGDDGATYPFHCVAMVDGSRTIEPGTAVWFTVCRRLGRREAWAISPR